MKKKIPNLINVDIPYGAESVEAFHLMTIQNDIKSGYSISYYDFDLYCAIIIRLYGIDKLPENIRNYCMQDDKLKDNSLFQKIRLMKQLGKVFSEEEVSFFQDHLRRKVRERKQILRDEIKRTGINPLKLTVGNSPYLRLLLSIVRDFDDELTLIHWFIPVKLTFKKFVHIYVKHVEDTKFSEGAFKNRTYFNYETEEIFTLLKAVLRQHEEEIKEHLLYISIANENNHPEYKNLYMNNWISYNGDTFALAIDNNGYITKFHQKNTK
ncbi:MAG: hypothetical protein LCH67_07065 [Bacteroidetes bacterium]|nr:hypothetical protein [Bacteroidota bacterium]